MAKRGRQESRGAAALHQLWLVLAAVLRAKGRLVVCVLFGMVVVLRVPLPGLVWAREAVPAVLLPGGRGGGGGDVLRYVDPLIGTAGGGHVFAGATVPYGMAKPVADSTDRRENAGGYVQDFSSIGGFSHLHDSGTGGVHTCTSSPHGDLTDIAQQSPSLGNFPLFVHPGCPDDDITKCTYTVKSRAVLRLPYMTRARPGYFSIRLKNSVAAEMTATHHTALYRFTFPDAARSSSSSGGGGGETNGHGAPIPPASGPLVLIDLQDLGSSRQRGGAGVAVNSTGGAGPRITGAGRFAPSFGQGSYSAYFCADFRGARARRSGTFVGDKPDAAQQVLQDELKGSGGGWVQFEKVAPGEGLLARVGVSFVSRERACWHAEREIPGFEFEGTVRKAEAEWREKLAAVRVEEADVEPALLVTFWSGLYRTMLSPQDYTGENVLWESEEPYFDSFYCIWDSFRAQHPLLSIIDPLVQTKMVRTLVDVYRHLGKLPDCRMSFCKGFSQGGSNADVVIADAYIKGITDGIDWNTAYEAVVSDAEVEPPDWNLEGRGNLASYHALGYIPSDDKPNPSTSGRLTRSISRTVEYAYDDFTIAQLGRALGKPAADYRRYMQRSTNWRNLWNAAQEDAVLVDDTTGATALGSDFTGFLQPRQRDGSFAHQPTRMCSPVYERHRCYLDTDEQTYEGSPWLYSFFVPHDMAGLVAAMGGPGRFAARLDYFHDSGIADLGNEQAFLPVFQFHYAGRPGRSAHWAHRYVPARFNTTFAGLPGNDDGAMGAFSGFAMMGFFPVAGQDVYLLTPPFFREVKLRARNGQWAVLRVANFDPTYEGKYIQNATLDGRPYTRSWITHQFFMEGGVLEFVVGREEGPDWGTAAEDLPPSWGWTPDRK